MSEICVLCNVAPATTREHVPAELFFDAPNRGDLIQVPACVPCNQGSQKDEYLRAFLMLLRSPRAPEATENVRARTIRQLHRPGYGGLRATFQESSKLTVRIDPFTGALQPDLQIRPDGERLLGVIIKYVRGLHYRLTGSALATDPPIAVERMFNHHTRPSEH